MIAISYGVPAQLRAGDTWTWKKNLPDYPPGSWTLRYSLRNASSKVNITATTSGSDYLVTVAAAASAAYAPGRYNWIAYVTGGASEQYTVEQGSIDVLPNLSLDVTYDARTDARKVYDDLITAYKSYVGSNGMMANFSIAGKTVTFKSSAEFIQQIQFWARRVREEEAAEAVKKGFGNPNRVGVRFTRI